MNDLVELGKVDLRFAKAYLPICALYAELVGIAVLVLFSRLAAIESWTLAAIVVWFSKRVITEEVFQYNSLLETVTLASILTHYRALRENRESVVIERVVSVLWFLCFSSVNVILSISRTQSRRAHPHKIAMWACTLVLMLYSVYTPMNDGIVAFDVIKAFLFLTLSVIWVYLYDNKGLRYDRLHDCEECKLRFLPLLFTPVALSLAMVAIFMLGIAYAIAFHQRRPAPAETKQADKGAENLDTSFEVAEDDQEIFRIAMQSQEGGLKSA